MKREDGGSWFDRARQLLAKKKRHHLVSSELLNGLVQEMGWAARQLQALERRRDELLALIARISKEAAREGEAEELRGQVAALIARVGSLEAEKIIARASAEVDAAIDDVQLYLNGRDPDGPADA